MLGCSYFFLAPQTNFGCKEPAEAAAYADAGVCPTSVETAAQDAQWAEARIAEIPRNGKETTGILYDSDGYGESITSGESGAEFDAAWAYLDPFLSLLTDHPPGKQVAGHVETKAAAVMRDAAETFGVLVINNPRGPCDCASGVGCESAPMMILPCGSTLVLWWPGGGPLVLEGRGG